MKTNEQIAEMIRLRQYDGARYACIARITENRLDGQAWSFLGTASLGMQRARTAQLCFERAALLDPYSTSVDNAAKDAANRPPGRIDGRIGKLLATQTTTVSANILTRDNESTIRDCIVAIRDAVDEVVVVDTGSSDRTVEIVESLGVKVHRFEWIDDFSAARNHALALSSSEWAIGVDSDEILLADDVGAIREAAGLYADFVGPLVISSIIINRFGQQHELKRPSRMFKNDGSIKWFRRIHEFPAPADGSPLTTVHAPVLRMRFDHRGYDPTVADTEAKYRRNLKLLLKDVADHPTDARTLHFIGREYVLLSEFENGMKYLNEAKRHLSPTEERIYLPAIERYMRVATGEMERSAGEVPHGREE